MIYARSDIPEDEPVFILRAQDELAAPLVVEWAERYLQRGGGIELHRQAMEIAVDMRSWARKHGTKLPSLDHPAKPLPADERLEP